MTRNVLLGLFVAILCSCGSDDDDAIPPVTPPVDTVSPVVFDLTEVPYGKLSDYLFFEGSIADQNPSLGVLPYDVITPLFSDYSKKKRFLWMPDSVKASYNGDHDILQFQDGTVMLKTFYYDNVQPANTRRNIETRMEFMRDGVWEFAEYVWNEDQTEAFLDLSGSFTPVSWMDEQGEIQNVNWRIPAQAECHTCHKVGDNSIPIGPKPQNINKMYNYSDGVKNQLEKWVAMGYLEAGYPTNIITVADYADPDADIEERVRAYLDMNCAHCHRQGSHCDYRPVRFAYSETVDPNNLGICVEPDQQFDPSLTHIITPGNVNRSMLHFRMNTNEEDKRMPLLGRTIIHREGVQLITDYINSLEGPC